MTDTVRGAPLESAPDDVALEQAAAVGTLWTGSRLLIGSLSFLWGAFVFTYFYLRSLNSSGMWHPHNERPSVILGGWILGLVLASAFMQNFSMARLRGGYELDWQVGTACELAFMFLAIGLQIWDLTRLPFQPGDGAFASLFVGWAPVYAVVLFGSAYWVETLFARSLRLRKALAPEGGFAGSPDPEAQLFRASLDGYTYYWNYMALISLLFWFLFYVVS